MHGNISGTSVNMDAQRDTVGGLSSHKITSKGNVYLNSRQGSIQNELAVYSDQKIYVRISPIGPIYKEHLSITSCTLLRGIIRLL
ncbi:MAG: hypothetical protein LVR00_05635 [Rhabdochlamydiaceae bacterium]|jgi:hypothetical protein